MYAIGFINGQINNWNARGRTYVEFSSAKPVDFLELLKELVIPDIELTKTQQKILAGMIKSFCCLAVYHDDKTRDDYVATRALAVATFINSCRC